MNSLRHILLLTLLAMAVTSCQKEEAIQPCGQDTEAPEATAKDLPVGGTGNADPEPSEGNTNGTTEPAPDEDPTGISDDGDDISDGEKSRKKRR